MEEWKEYQLKDATTVLGDGLHGTPKYDENGTVFFINGNNLVDGKIEIKESTKRVSEDEANKYKKNLNSRTILVSINGTIGNVAKYQGEACILGKSACYFNVSEDFDLNFIYYVVASKQFKNSITHLSTGTTIKNVSLETMRNYSFAAPSINEQKRIAELLSSLDDKIELNRRINDNLEQQAQALFKSWFVDFEPFRGEKFVKSEFGMIPKGWYIGSIYEQIDVVYGAPYSSSLFNESNNGLPLIRIRDLKTYSPQVHTTEILPNTEYIATGDVVAGMDAEFIPTIWLGETGILNQRCCKFIARDAMVSNYYVLHLIKPELEFVQSYKTGTTVSHLGKCDIDKFRIIVPPNNIVIKFSKLVNALFREKVRIASESRNLTTLRNSLLPKLMSGELNINNLNC